MKKEKVTHRKLRNILIVDDSEDIHSLMDIFLRKRKKEEPLFVDLLPFKIEDIKNEKYEDIGEDIVIDHAFQGDDAIDMVHLSEKAGNPYDLIFVDMNMPPGLNGLDTIREIVKKYPFKNCVLCSAYMEKVKDQTFGDIEWKGKNVMFLRKPFTAKKVNHILDQIEAKRKVA